MSLTEAAASAVARAFFYPSLAWNMARNRLQDDWHWWDSITDGVILGAIPFFSQLQELKGLGVTAVVTLNEEFEVFITSDQYKEQGFAHLHIPTVDFLYAPPTENLHQGADFIHEHANNGNKTYVHCKAGRGRSTTLVLCYLVKYFGYDPEQAYAFVRQKRPQVYLAQGQWTAVCAFYVSCHPEEDLDPAHFPYPKFLPIAPGQQGSDGPEPQATENTSDATQPSPVEMSCSDNADSEESEKEGKSCRFPQLQEGDDIERLYRCTDQDLESLDERRAEAEVESLTKSKLQDKDREQCSTAKGQASCSTLTFDRLAAALGACSIQGAPELGGTKNTSDLRGVSPPARASSPAITIPQPKQAPIDETPKCSISIEPSGSLPGYVRIRSQRQGRRQNELSPASICSPSLDSEVQDSDTPHDLKSKFAEICDEDDDWASVNSD